jgi:hypothetical protein
VHQLQGEAEGLVKHEELQKTLAEFTAERLALLQRHEAGARAVSNYDFNNTYQNIIGREETQLGWLRNALGELGAPLPGAAPVIAVPDLSKASNHDAGRFRGVLEDDARHLQRFVEKWRTRLEDFTHARHRKMLDVILGESVEHQRLFEQAASGFEDLLGRRTGGVARVGGVLSSRWVE